MQQNTVNPAVLKSSPLRQLYEVLSVFERNRDWSIVARRQLIDQVSARLPQLHQPDVFLLHSLLEEIGIDPTSTEGGGRSSTAGPGSALDELDSMPSISQFSRSNSLPRMQTRPSQGVLGQPPQTTSLQATDDNGVPVLTPQVAGEMTPQEMSAFVMLKMFGDLSEQRIESWGRVAKLIVTQPMDGFVAKDEELTRWDL